MSVVTNFILVCSIDDAGAHELESKFHPILFNQIDGDAGGNKCLEVDVWAAAVNYTRAAGITIKSVMDCDWEFPESVMLMVQHQEEDSPSVFVIRGGKCVSYC